MALISEAHELTLAPLTITADEVRLATQRLTREASDLLDVIAPAPYPTPSATPERRATPRWEK